MSDRLEFEGKDLAEALETAARKLGAPVASLRYELLEESRRGVLGLGSRPCRIRVQVPRPAPRGAGGEGSATTPGAPCPPLLLATFTRIIELMGLDLEVAASRSAAGVSLSLTGGDRPVLLAREGELLSALEFLLNRMGRRAWPEAGIVQLTCRGARSRRDDEVVELAREVAMQVARTGRPSKLHPMNPYERRLAHLTVRDFPGLASRSEGEGFLKQVVVEKIGEAGNGEPS